jgi:hypothetical protein
MKKYILGGGCHEHFLPTFEAKHAQNGSEKTQIFFKNVIQNKL